MERRRTAMICYLFAFVEGMMIIVLEHISSGWLCSGSHS